MARTAAWMILSAGLAAALLTLSATAEAQAPFSGVTVDSLLDAPNRAHGAIIDASGGEILAYGTGMEVGEFNGETAAITQDGFELLVTADLPVGAVSLLLEVGAPTKGSDSYFAELDGQPIGEHIVLPYEHIGTVSATAWIDTAGSHTFRLYHREGPGSALRRIALGGTIHAPQPAMRAELEGQHPRLLFTSADVAALRQRLADPRVQEFYRIPGVLDDPPPAYDPSSRNGGPFRPLGRYAFGHLLEPDPAQLSAVLDWLQMAVSYGDVGVDLDAEYFLEGLALTYDWIYDEIPTALRDQVRSTMVDKCRILFMASLDGRNGGGLAFQQNHYWYSNFALALGAAALYGEEPEAAQWLPWAWDRLERILLSFSPDGTFHEGPAYWDFSMPTLYLYVDFYEYLTGLPIPAGNEGFSGQARFRFHHLFPGLERTVPMEDTTADRARPPTRLLLWEAKRFGDTGAMGMAEQVRSSASSYAQDLLWLDESLGGDDPLQSEPEGAYFADVETAFGRSSWDADATHVSFVSRPLGGHTWAELCDRYGLGGTGHNHPAQNHFVLFGQGEMLIGDPGYTYEKKTRNHNTVLVDDQGQYGDGEMWPNPTPGRAHVTEFVHEGDITISGGDATSAYPEELGLTLFQRYVVLVGPELVVVHDRLTAAEDRRFSWLLHHYSDSMEGEGPWTLSRGEAQLTAQALAPTDWTATTETYRPEYIHPSRDITPDEPDVQLLELQTGPATDATFLVPLQIGAAGTEPPVPLDSSRADYDGVQVEDVLVAFNRTDQEITIELPWGESLTTSARVVVARLRDGELQVVTAPDDDPAASGPTAGEGEGDDGCGCRVRGGDDGGTAAPWLWLGLLLLARRFRELGDHKLHKLAPSPESGATRNSPAISEGWGAQASQACTVPRG